MNNQDTTSQNEIRLDWHSAFYAAIQAELVEYLDILEFKQEYHLNEQPLRIDVVVIKMPPDAKITKNFAEIFKGCNLVEYKSPEKSLSVSDYLKVLGYAYLYQAIENVNYTDMTITFVCTMKPEALLTHLRSDPSGRYAVTEKQPGIYVIEGERFPVQILESKLLPPEENAWLTSLKENTDRVALEQAMELSPTVEEKVNLSAFWYVVAYANVDMIREVVKMSYAQVEEKWEKLFDEIGYTEKVERRGEVKGLEKGINMTLAVMEGLQKNVPPAKLSADTGMPLERVEVIRKKIYG